MNKLILYLRNFDWLVFFSVLLLIAFGLAEIYSISLGQGNVDLPGFKKQVFFVLAGLVLLFLFSFVNYHNLRFFSNYFYIIGVIILGLVLAFGSTIRGTKGWFNFAGFNFQPVEFIKIVLIIFLARYFSDISLRISQIKHLVISGIGALILFGLVLAQPDFGSGLLLFAVWLSMLAMAGFRKRYFIILFAVMAIAAVLAWSFFFKPYQKERVMTFLNPSANSLDQGYNVTQAMIAVGSGRLFGRGIGFGSQSQLKFLPESSTDFIFAVISEELGFLGVVLVIIFFSIFFFKTLANIRNIKDDFGIFFILGALSLIFVEMFVNIGMNIGLLPVVGIALPFISYGGSSMVANLVMVGIMENIIIRSKIR